MMPIYAVTFCTMDQEAGSNPFWHTCILLSSFDNNTKKLEVVDSWGFYGLPTTVSDSIFRRVKIQIGLDVDLTGNHGMLRHEEVRYLDLGRGLRGVTFELTAEKFIELQKKSEKMAFEQTQAINEIIKPLNLRGKTPEKTRIYPYEEFSPHIFALENAMAKEQGRSSRLKPFELTLFNNANTCKAQVLSILEGILTPDQIKRLTGFHRSVPRFSGKMERIFLHSSGPTRRHTKRSGEIVHYRDGQDKNVKLHWTLPPQEIETLSGEIRDLFKVHNDHRDDVKTVIRQLQRLEWLFINAILDEKYFSSREKLITLIRMHYESFAAIEPKKAKTTTTGWNGSLLWLFSQPRDEDEAILLKNLANAKMLFNNLYMAITDSWEMSPAEEKAEFADEHTYLDEDLEALATCLTPSKQKELCAIIGRNYIKPEALRLA